MQKSIVRKEILYVQSSSKDNKGKRVIVISDNTENTLFPGEESDPISKVIGLNDSDIDEIKRFWGKTERRLI
jgi:hypothetical protein